MSHRWICAWALMLTLGGVSPAFAATRLAAFSWAPASGPVAGYLVYVTTGDVTDQLAGAVARSSAVISIDGDRSVTVRVAAYDSSGRVGPRSDASAPVRLCLGDFDGDEVWGADDWEDTRSCFGKPATGFCAGADLDLDGIVSLRDLNAVKVGSRACAPEICPGDFDGNRYIGITDLNRARACFGQPAQGDCLAGDVDGDGIVSLVDVNFVSKAFGLDACTL